MSLPPGVTTVPVSIVPPDGVSANNIQVTVSPTLDLRWAATNDKLEDMIPGLNRFEWHLPAVDQDGFVTTNGDPFKGWQYVMTFSGNVGGVPFAESHLYQTYLSQSSTVVHVMVQPQSPIAGPQSAVTRADLDTSLNFLTNQSNLALAISIALS
jgi:hypothetical protein